MHIKELQRSEIFVTVGESPRGRSKMFKSYGVAAFLFYYLRISPLRGFKEIAYFTMGFRPRLQECRSDAALKQFGIKIESKKIIQWRNTPPQYMGNK